MDPNTSSEITHKFPPFFQVHKDGRVERFMISGFAPPTVDPRTGVESKDVVISPRTAVKSRIFLPKINGPDPKKLPLLVHYHGGGFCAGSALDAVTAPFLTRLVSEANVIAISVDYRLAPEHPLPTAFDDSWAALQWIGAHLNGTGPELWLNKYVDFERVFLMGESAGATIAHHVAVRVGATPGPEGLRVRGAVIAHPYFVISEPDEMLRFLYPGSSGTDSDPKLSPKADPDVGKMGVDKVLVLVAEKDWLKPRGVEYCEALRNSGWKGDVELVENQGEDHVFFMFNPDCENALIVVQKLASFINQASG
ncbi:hypothetical protein RHSIM_Rhsim05G0082400 [Rhododendron simsii]|uniref:Alpha/beta hydrolase fold-3 domain-containing protein n=1 Tax=Rhododendron simsii TaxID=118357 RepID=A0A834GXL2_RHOSS|nr:hypothetical protein RHSIM_Rhsim05G0082400 [Rhododendron simsii]